MEVLLRAGDAAEQSTKSKATRVKKKGEKSEIFP